MRHQGKWTMTLIGAVALLTLPDPAIAGTTYYVDALNGSDGVGANNCIVAALPCRTVTHAFTQVSSGVAGDPNVVLVAPGIYDQAVNGETYPITLDADYISLEGADAATTIFDGSAATTDSALIINANGFSLAGFTFRNNLTAVYISRGGFSASDNIFEDTVINGVLLSISNPFDDADFTVDPISLTDNMFFCDNAGVELEIGLTFDGAGTPNLAATVGDITFTGNSFTGCHVGITLNELYIRYMDNGTAVVGNIEATGNSFTDCYRGIELDDLYVESMTDSSVTWGDITLDDNSFTRIEYGIEFNGRFGESGSEKITDTTISLGNISVSGNSFTDNIQSAITADYFDVRYLYGDSDATLGDFFVQDNTIKADALPVSGIGIQIDNIGYIANIYGSSTVTTGAVTISGNSVESSDNALFLYNEGVYSIGSAGGADTAAVSFGPINITDNPEFSSTNSYGLYLDIDYIGYDQYGQTRVDAGIITVDNNTISSGDSAGFYMYYYYDSGYSMDDDALLEIGGLTFTNNNITGIDFGAYFELYELGYQMNGNSKMSVGPTIVSGNTIESSGTALYFDFEEYVAYEMYDSSVFTMDTWTIRDNTLTTTGSPSYGALTIYYYDYYVGSYMEDDSSATLPDWVISDNEIDVGGGGDGIYYHTYSNPDDNYGNAAVHYGSIVVDGNTFNKDKDDGMERGIYFWIEDVCEDCYDSSTFSHGGITITANSIYSAEDVGINVEYDDVGYSFDDDGKVTMGNVTIADNLIDTAPRGIYAGYASIRSEASAVVTLGTLDITGNTVRNIEDDGIYFDISAYNDEPLTASVNIGKTTISDNTVTASGSSGSKSSGIWVNGDIGKDVLFAAPEVSNNTVTGFAVGIGMDDLPEATLSCNSVENNSDYGLFFLSDGDFIAVSNTLVDNGLGLKVEDSSFAVITAENNWWGDAAGPVACGSCNGVNAGGGTVDYDPWLTSEPVSLCGGSAFPWNLFMPAITGMKP